MGEKYEKVYNRKGGKSKINFKIEIKMIKYVQKGENNGKTIDEEKNVVVCGGGEVQFSEWKGRVVGYMVFLPMNTLLLHG